MKDDAGGGNKQDCCRGFMKVCVAAIKSFFQLSLVITLGLSCYGQNLFAQSAPKQAKSTTAKVEPVKQNPTTPKTMVTDFFGEKLSVRNPFEGKVIQVIDEFELSQEQLQKEEEARKAQAEKEEKERQAALGRTSADAPDQFKNLIVSYRLGDIKGAEKFADDYVAYMMNLMFEVKQITGLIGKALVKRGAVEEDDMVGVGQYLDVNFAEARANNYSPLRPTHEEAMKRITPDPKGQAEIYYFFTPSCEYCRAMAADVERLWTIVKGDKNLRMAALTVAPGTKGLIDSYRQYTGLTLPILDGRQVAKSFSVAFIPALVVVASNSKVAYLKSGEQNFQRMYEFVRKVQGLPADITPDIKKLIATPIGEQERKQNKTNLLVTNKTIKNKSSQLEAKAMLPNRNENSNVELSRF